MKRVVGMVDAGYLLRHAIEIISNKASSSRSDLDINDPAGLIKALLDTSRSTLDLRDKELLRVYWYDGVLSNGFTPQQRALVGIDDVQFRAGTINGKGQQKGVDSLIVTDLIELTSHHAICDAVLVTGDSDLAVGIEIAQKRGVRIAVLGVEDLAAGVLHHQSFEITSRADRVGMLGQADLAPVLRFVPPAPVVPRPVVAVKQPAGVKPPAGQKAVAPPAAAVDQQKVEAAVKAFIAQQAVPLVGAVDLTTKRIDAAIDRALLHHVFTDLGHGKLTEAEKVLARQIFRSEV